jgi:hypothetical protein
MVDVQVWLKSTVAQLGQEAVPTIEFVWLGPCIGKLITKTLSETVDRHS